jgi:hypothetical protein
MSRGNCVERPGIADIMAGLKVMGVPEAVWGVGRVRKKAARQASYPSSRPAIYTDLLYADIYRYIGYILWWSSVAPPELSPDSGL